MIKISMTSYPKRITNVSKSIFAILNKQTVKPDEIHLWLSIEEFPSKEKDLPEDLLVMIELPNVFLHWLDKNIYVLKRHEIFKYTSDDDLVFFIDDDVFYSDKLIETCLEQHKKYKNAIIQYNGYDCHHYRNSEILIDKKANGGPWVNHVRWCGQSMIPAAIYPKIIFSDRFQHILNEVNSKSDEVILQPLLVYYDIPIFCCNLGWGTLINKNLNWHSGHAPFNRRNVWLKHYLSLAPELYEKYKRLFGYK